MIHDLKCWEEFYELIESGAKTFEIRDNDRNFQVGDVLHLREYLKWDMAYTGRSLDVEVTYILSDDFIGLREGYVAMQIRMMNEQEVEEALVEAGVSLYA